jgi:glyoxylase-like metal-dependent hydrolase (beta-lactamase superfamily II)
MDVYHTPGHTEGSVTYFIDGKYLITGDTLFIISAGRPDLGGKAEKWVCDLYKTLIHQYAELPGDAAVLPAHYVTWEEANEDLRFVAPLKKLRENNPIFTLASENEFVQFIFDHMREMPEVYIDIKQVNRGLINVTDEEADIMDLGKNECAASHYDNS